MYILSWIRFVLKVPQTGEAGRRRGDQVWRCRFSGSSRWSFFVSTRKHFRHLKRDIGVYRILRMKMHHTYFIDPKADTAAVSVAQNGRVRQGLDHQSHKADKHVSRDDKVTTTTIKNAASSTWCWRQFEQHDNLGVTFNWVSLYFSQMKSWDSGKHLMCV